jgi:hypothetical protein
VDQKIGGRSKQLLDPLKFQEGKLCEVQQQTEKCMGTLGKVVTLWITTYEVDVLTAWSLVAGTGVRTKQFPSAQRLALRAGSCSGNGESTNKTRTGRKPSVAPRIQSDGLGGPYHGHLPCGSLSMAGRSACRQAGNHLPCPPHPFHRLFSGQN